MADLKTLCIDGECRNIPQGGGGFPLVQVTSVDQLNAIDYPAIVYGSLEIPDSGITGYDWVGIVMPSPGQITQIIDVGGTELIRFNDSPPSGSWVLGKNAKLNSPAFTGTPTAPTNGTASTSNTQIATTAFVQNAIKRRLPTTVNSGSVAAVSVPTGGTEKYSANFWTAPSNGVAFFSATTSFVANATGIRFAGIYQGSTGIGASEAVQAASTGITQINLGRPRRVTSGQTFRMRYTQTGSAAINATTEWAVYFIPD